jgi:hypothetical protein
MKKFLVMLVVTGLLWGGVSAAADSYQATVTLVKHKAQKHKAHKATKHKMPKRSHHTV